MTGYTKHPAGDYEDEHEAGTLEVLPGSSKTAEVARIFHRSPGHPIWVATHMLVEALDRCRAQPNLRLILTGAGLAWHWQQSNVTEWRLPIPEEFEVFRQQARQQAELIRAELKLGPGDPALLLGLDVYATSERSSRDLPVGQFAVLLRPAPGDVVVMAKGLPTVSEVGFVPVPVDGVRDFPSLLSPGKLDVALVCHDVNALHPRGDATSSHPDRLEWREALLLQMKQAGLAHAFHLAHCMWQESSFQVAYNQWASEIEIPLLGATGMDKSVQSPQQARAIAAALRWPSNFKTYDLWERPR